MTTFQIAIRSLPLRLAFAVTAVTACGHVNAQETSKVTTPIESTEADPVRLAKALATLTRLVKTEQFANLKEVEELLDGEFAVELQHPSAIHYKLVSRDKNWRATALINIGTASLTGKPWIRTIELVAESICIPESELSEKWFLEAQIPVKKSVFNRDGISGWVKSDIPHVVYDMRWSYRITPNRGVSYWLSSLNPKACANGFSFSFSPKSQE
jgi:hypothetical protein